ncbi:hypothetical protein [Rhodococcus sp. IEGM 1379]|uniref:hypothetical protein n=1 Tax=Rhodococcus sp. IEGM 1379 TaxID=3047086 RepID=UPI0024B794B8|nr:hypothetical protein [Rhodococcus sp. IEGM 1379]MDI9918628.1 hypothetical protein [Rhodococcus sp. IEGM 1379]
MSVISIFHGDPTSVADVAGHVVGTRVVDPSKSMLQISPPTTDLATYDLVGCRPEIC